MPDQPSQQPAPQIPTQGASQFMFTLSASDILMAVGHGRVAIGQDENGNPKPLPGIEWLLSLSMSPTAAKVLLDALGESLKRYEATFGKIPMDPKMTTKFAEAKK